MPASQRDVARQAGCCASPATHRRKEKGVVGRDSDLPHHAAPDIDDDQTLVEELACPPTHAT